MGSYSYSCAVVVLVQEYDHEELLLYNTPKIEREEQIGSWIYSESAGRKVVTRDQCAEEGTGHEAVDKEAEM